jgi:hypothetical protein
LSDTLVENTAVLDAGLIVPALLMPYRTGRHEEASGDPTTHGSGRRGVLGANARRTAARRWRRTMNAMLSVSNGVLIVTTIGDSASGRVLVTDLVLDDGRCERHDRDATAV